MTLKNFVNIFESDKFGDKVCKVVKEEFNYQLYLQNVVNRQKERKPTMDTTNSDLN